MTRKEEYAAYLKTQHWKEFKAAKRKEEPKVCSACKATKRIQLHHMLYRTPFEDAKLSDTIWLCQPCHALFHAKSKMLQGVPFSDLKEATLKVIRGKKSKAAKDAKRLSKRQRRKARMERKSWQSKAIPNRPKVTVPSPFRPVTIAIVAVNPKRIATDV